MRLRVIAFAATLTAAGLLVAAELCLGASCCRREVRRRDP
jgi:hypothetical protein